MNMPEKAIKWSVKGVDPNESKARSFEPPKSGVYEAKVHEVTFEATNKEGKPQPRLHVVAEITDAKVHNGAYVGSRLHSYVFLELETMKRRLDQFMQAMGEADESKREGSIVPSKLVGRKARIRVKGPQNEGDSAELDAWFPYKPDGEAERPGDADDSDLDVDLEVEEPGEEESDEGITYTEDELNEMELGDLKTVATDLGVTLPKKVNRKKLVADILAAQETGDEESVDGGPLYEREALEALVESDDTDELERIRVELGIEDDAWDEAEDWDAAVELIVKAQEPF